MNEYTQRQWDRTVGWGKVPKEYQVLNGNMSENLLIQRVLENELLRMEALQEGLYTDQDATVRKWMEKRIKDLTKDTE